MTEPLALSIFQGTYATRTMLVDMGGQIRFSSIADIALSRKGKLRVEQNPEELLAATDTTLQAALTEAKKLGEIVCAGIAVQRSSVVAWDRTTGKALTPVINWQDRRGARWLQDLAERAEIVKARTGLPLSANYGGSKLRWMATHDPDVRRAILEGNIAWGPLGAFLLHHLLEGSPYRVDHATAQRTQLFSLSEKRWDPLLMEMFEIPPETLPETLPTCHHYGRLAAANIPITAVAGDQNAAFFSLGNPRRNTTAVNIGTGAFLLTPIGPKAALHPKLPMGLLYSTASGKTLYGLEGGLSSVGAAISWAAKKWQMPDLVLRLPEFFRETETPPLFINTIGSVGPPHRETEIEPFFVGEAAIPAKAVALAESILFLIQSNLDTLKSGGYHTDRLRIIGGLSHLDALCQRMADLSGLVVYRPADTEATARGAAWLAFQCPKRWPKPGKGRIFEPESNPPLRERYQQFCHIMENTVTP